MKRKRKKGIYDVLRNPVRSEIIRLLGERGALSFSELRESLPKMSVGTLYYHLEVLRGLVEQDKQRRYRLTEEGVRVFREMFRVEDRLKPIEHLISAPAGFIYVVLAIFSLRPILLDASYRPKVYYPFAILSILISSFVSYSARRTQIGMFFVKAPFKDFLLYFGAAFLNVLAMFLVVDLVLTLVFKFRGGDGSLFVTFALANLMLSLYPLVKLIMISLLAEVIPMIDMLALIAAHSWTLVIVTYGICYSKRMRIDKAIISSLALMYANVLLLFFTGLVSF